MNTLADGGTYDDISWALGQAISSKVQYKSGYKPRVVKSIITLGNVSGPNLHTLKGL